MLRASADCIGNRSSTIPWQAKCTIDVAVGRLRRKLEDDGRNPGLIKTVRGGGSVLAATVTRL